MDTLIPEAIVKGEEELENRKKAKLDEVAAEEAEAVEAEKSVDNDGDVKM